MYFVDLEGAKKRLAAGPMPGAVLLPYLLAHELLYLQLFPSSPFLPRGGLQWVEWGAMLLANAGGFWWLYACNGGARGWFLAERYLVLGWVIGWRLFVVIVLPFLVALFTGFDLEAWFVHHLGPRLILLPALLLFAAYYGWIGWHLRDLRTVGPAGLPAAAPPAS